MSKKIVPIKKIFKIIDSCINSEQLKTCKKIADLYTKMASLNGIVNYEVIREVLYIHINEKREEMGMAFKFNGFIRRKKIKFSKPEYELIENLC